MINKNSSKVFFSLMAMLDNFTVSLALIHQDKTLSR